MFSIAGLYKFLYFVVELSYEENGTHGFLSCIRKASLVDFQGRTRRENHGGLEVKSLKC